jgi:hypothetical protein
MRAQETQLARVTRESKVTGLNSHMRPDVQALVLPIR